MGKLCDAPGCGEYIKFIRTTAGRHIPVPDVEPETQYFFPDQPGHAQVIIVTEGGDVLRGREGKQTDNGVAKVEGWRSHFSDCPGRGKGANP